MIFEYLILSLFLLVIVDIELRMIRWWYFDRLKPLMKDIEQEFEEHYFRKD